MSSPARACFPASVVSVCLRLWGACSVCCIADIAGVENMHASYLRRRRWPASHHLAGPLRRSPALASAARARGAGIADPKDSAVVRLSGALLLAELGARSFAAGVAPLQCSTRLHVDGCRFTRSCCRFLNVRHQEAPIGPTARWSVWSTPLPLQPRAICTPRDAQNMYIDVNGY